jgi:phosphoribosylformimino-5-aminoimidazole carboxamide ribotide isomerase
MKIYPAIDILHGKAVRLRQGRTEEATIYGAPLEMAERWARGGAEWLHVVDLEGAFDGVGKNHHIVADIVKSFPQLKVQLGGGIRNRKTLESVLGCGVHRAVLGTSAVRDVSFVTDALQWNPDRVAFGIDAHNGVAKVSGWTEDSRINAIDLARKLEDLGARLIIYTDIARDGVLQGPNIQAMRQMLQGVGLSVIASGGISTLDDLRDLASLNDQKLDGVIIGKALYEGLIDIKEALALAD